MDKIEEIVSTPGGVAAVLGSLGVIAALVVPPYLYSKAASSARTRFPGLRNKSICLLIAHPDDEAMFFAPTVLALTRPEAGNDVKILCLSTGNADGLGETRKKELQKSAMLLGLEEEDDVEVIDSPDFPDSMTADWEAGPIAALLSRKFTPHLAAEKKSKSLKHPSSEIDAIITFDSSGVSSHPNHSSLYFGARAFLRLLVRDRPDWTPPIDLYTLTSVGFARKYTSLFDAWPTLLFAMASSPSPPPKTEDDDDEDEFPDRVVSMSALSSGGGASTSDESKRECYATARRAMVEAHKSQMVWFRWGWISMSRYMLINDLKREQIVKK